MEKCEKCNSVNVDYIISCINIVGNTTPHILDAKLARGQLKRIIEHLKDSNIKIEFGTFDPL